MFYRLKQNLKSNISLPASLCHNLSDFVHRPAVLPVLLYFAVCLFVFIWNVLPGREFLLWQPGSSHSTWRAVLFLLLFFLLVNACLTLSQRDLWAQTHTHTQTYSILRGNFPQTDRWLKSRLTHTHTHTSRCLDFFLVPHGPWRPA